MAKEPFHLDKISACQRRGSLVTVGREITDFLDTRDIMFVSYSLYTQGHIQRHIRLHIYGKVDCH